MTLACSFDTKLVLNKSLFFFKQPFLSLFTARPTIVTTNVREVEVVKFSCTFDTFVSYTVTTSEKVNGDVTPAFVMVVKSYMFHVV